MFNITRFIWSGLNSNQAAFTPEDLYSRKRPIETKVIAWCFVCYAATSMINIDLIST
jgi:hypothetical protein